VRNTLEYVALLLTTTAVFAYANHFLLRLPRNAGLLVIALVLSITLRVLEGAFPSLGLSGALGSAFDNIDFGQTLLNGFLAFLLFAGAIEVELKGLLERKWTVLALATLGVLISTLAMAGGMFLIFRAIGLNVPMSYCLVFGALISPTDPVTVLDALGKLPVPTRLQSTIAGESLFNDGIGIVLFTIFLRQATSGGTLSIEGAVLDFGRQAFGGATLGAITGGTALLAMRGIDEYNIELIISLALVTGTYAVAQAIDVSGPVAVVVAGLLIGSIGREYAVSDRTRDYLEKFWLLTDEVLNALLFLLIGFAFATVALRWTYLAAAGLAIPLSVAVRLLSIAITALPLHLHSPRKLAAMTLLTWSALRGGIAVALALSLPTSSYRAALLTVSYAVVVFTMIVQGLTLRPLATRLYTSVSGEDHGQ
jgi:monovalent cation:H+ antiporter, CPA1 family